MRKVKRPTDKPEPTFCGHKMKWFFGSFWKHRSPDGEVVVRAWPAQKDDEQGDERVEPPEVYLVTPTQGEWFKGKYRTHKELLRVLARAERELLRAYKDVAEEYKTLLKVVKG